MICVFLLSAGLSGFLYPHVNLIFITICDVSKWTTTNMVSTSSEKWLVNGRQNRWLLPLTYVRLMPSLLRLSVVEFVPVERFKKLRPSANATGELEGQTKLELKWTFASRIIWPNPNRATHEMVSKVYCFQLYALVGHGTNVCYERCQVNFFLVVGCFTGFKWTLSWWWNAIVRPMKRHIQW